MEMICIFLLLVILHMTEGQSFISSTAYSDSSCSNNGIKSCNVLNQCVSLGSGSWGANLYAYYVYVASEVLGDGDDYDGENKRNVYAMATYTDSLCTISNTENVMSIISLSCIQDSCCRTTFTQGTQTTTQYMLFVELPSCPVLDIDAASSLYPISSNWRFATLLVFIITSIVAYFHILKEQRKGYTTISSIEIIGQPGALLNHVAVKWNITYYRVLSGSFQRFAFKLFSSNYSVN